MPRLIIDAMNVIGARPDGWWRDRAGAARRLLANLERLARGRGETVVVVLDGRPLPGVPEGPDGSLLVLYADRPGPNAADRRIEEYVAADPDPGDLLVVTSDADLAARVRALGARVEGASAWRRRIDAVP